MIFLDGASICSFCDAVAHVEISVNDRFLGHSPAHNKEEKDRRILPCFCLADVLCCENSYAISSDIDLEMVHAKAFNCDRRPFSKFGIEVESKEPGVLDSQRESRSSGSKLTLERVPTSLTLHSCFAEHSAEYKSEGGLRGRTIVDYIGIENFGDGLGVFETSSSHHILLPFQ